MAKKSMIEREKKRIKLNNKYNPVLSLLNNIAEQRGDQPVWY